MVKPSTRTKVAVAALAAVLLLSACWFLLRREPGSTTRTAGAPTPSSWVPLGEEGVHESERLNYELHIPRTWNWVGLGDGLPEDVVEVAERRLVLPGGSTDGSGRGGRLVLAVSDLAPGSPTDLGALAGLPDVQRMLTNPFVDGGARALRVEIETGDVRMGGVPAARARTEGTARNLAGAAMPCEARMLVFVVLGRLYRLALWVWPSPPQPEASPPRRADAEHLRDDIDLIEILYVVPDPDGLKARRRRNVAEGWAVVAPDGFRDVAIDRTKAKNLAFAFEADGEGSVEATVDLWVFLQADPWVRPPEPGRHMEATWAEIAGARPRADLRTSPFPHGDFLALPDLRDVRAFHHVPSGPVGPPSISVLEAMGVASRSRDVRLGDVPVLATHRLCLRDGADVWICYTFWTSTTAFVLRVFGREEALLRRSGAVAELLRDFRLVDPR